MPVWLLLRKAPRLFSQPKRQQMGLGVGALGNGEWVLRSGWAEAMTGHLGSGGGTEQLENAKQTELEKMEMAKEGGEGAIGGNKILTQPDSSSRFN